MEEQEIKDSHEIPREEEYKIICFFKYKANTKLWKLSNIGLDKQAKEIEQTTSVPGHREKMWFLFGRTGLVWQWEGSAIAYILIQNHFMKNIKLYFISQKSVPGKRKTYYESKTWKPGKISLKKKTQDFTHMWNLKKQNRWTYRREKKREREGNKP